MNSIDQRIRDASDRLDDVTIDVNPRSIEQLDRRAVRRGAAGDVTKGFAVLALVFAPFIGWQMLKSGNSVGVSSSTIPPTAPTSSTASASSSESTTPPPAVVEASVPVNVNPNPFEQVSHDRVHQIIVDALSAQGVDAIDAVYSAKSTNPFDGSLALAASVDDSSVEVAVAEWATGSMPTDPEGMGEFVSSGCSAVETPHGWVLLDAADGGLRQAAVVGPSASVIVRDTGGDIPLETLQAVAQDVADQIGAATGQPYVPTASAREAEASDACQGVTVLATDISRQQVGQLFTDELIAHDLPITDYSLDPYQDIMMFNAYTDAPEEASIGINISAYTVTANAALTPQAELPAPDSADVRTNEDGERSVVAFAGITVVEISTSPALNGDDVSDELLATIALGLAQQLNDIEW